MFKVSQNNQAFPDFVDQSKSSIKAAAAVHNASGRCVRVIVCGGGGGV